MKTVLKVIQSLLITILVIGTIITLTTRTPFLSQFGINFFTVTGSSMEPNIPTGSLVFAGKFKLDDLKVGDIIIYKSKDSSSNSVIFVTHRISSIVKQEKDRQLNNNGETISKKVLTYEFVTKGDSNNTVDDTTVPSGNVIGIYRWHIPRIGTLLTTGSFSQGLTYLIILPALILIIWEIFEISEKIKSYYSRQKESELKILKTQIKKLKKNK